MLSWIIRTSYYEQVLLWGFTHVLDTIHQGTHHFPGWVSLYLGSQGPCHTHLLELLDLGLLKHGEHVGASAL